MDNVYDVVIIGGGPAGLTAGIYLARARMKTVLLERAHCGGQLLVLDTVENFPGFPDGIKGIELAEWICKQAEHFGLEAKTAEAVNIMLKKGEKEPFTIELRDGKRLLALSVVITTGAHWNSLGIPGEKEYTGRGVSYCATCDGPLFKGKDVVVVGGGDTAIEDALFLTKFANKVMVVHRRDKLRAAKILQERACANPKIKFHLNSIALEISGKNSSVEAVKIKDIVTNKETELECNGVFIFIGITPNSDIVQSILKLDEKGYIMSDEAMRASVDGIFAAGDVRKKMLRQIVTATGEGAVAAVSAQRYVEHIKGVEYPA